MRRQQALQAIRDNPDVSVLDLLDVEQLAEMMGRSLIRAMRDSQRNRRLSGHRKALE